MTVLLRVAAMIGYLGHRVDRIIGRLLGFLPFRVPGAVLVASLLIALAWSSAIATNEAIDARPRPLSTSVADLVAEERNAWVEVSGLLSGPHLDNSIYASDDVRYLRVLDEPHDHQVIHGEVLVEPGWRRQTIVPLTRGDGVTRWFYVLRDPDSTADALVVRSARNAEAIRTRSVRVTSAGTSTASHSSSRSAMPRRPTPRPAWMTSGTISRRRSARRFTMRMRSSAAADPPASTA